MWARRSSATCFACQTLPLVLFVGAVVAPAVSAQDDARAETTPPIGDSLLLLQKIDVYNLRKPDDAGARSAIDAEAIARLAADRPADILNTLPGVNIQMNSGQEHLIAIRSPVLTGGAGQGSFLILENGVPTRSPAFGNVNSLIELHHEVASGVEVVRGPGSARHGSNAVHGMINVILPLDTVYTPEARASVGSLGRARLDLITVPFRETDAGHTVAALSLAQDHGWRDETPSQQQKVSVSRSFDGGDWSFRSWLAATNLNQETAGFIIGAGAYENADTAETNPNPEAFRDAWSARIGARATTENAAGIFSITPYMHTQAMIFSQHFLPYGGVEKNGHTGGGAMVSQAFENADALTFAIGADVDFAQGYLKEIQPRAFAQFPGDRRFPQGIHYDYDVDTQMAALWADGSFKLSDTLRLTGGVRAETHRFDYSTAIPAGINGRFQVAQNREDEFSFVTPKAGLIWAFSDQHNVYINYARGARVPQVSDLYRLQNLQVPGEIESETVDSLELGWRGVALNGALKFELAAYHMQKENFFFRDSDGLNVIDGATQHQGVEVATTFDITGKLKLAGNVAWSDQTYTFDRSVRTGAANETIRRGNAIDTAPEWLGDVRLDWQASDALLMSLTLEHTGEYFLDPANAATYPGHTLFGARTGWRVNDQVELCVIARNLTDARFADRADISFGSQRFFPGEPLNVTFGFAKKF